MLFNDVGTNNVRNRTKLPGKRFTALVLLLVVLAGVIHNQFYDKGNQFKGLSFDKFRQLAGSIVNFEDKQGFDNRFLLTEGIPDLGAVNPTVANAGSDRLISLCFFTLTRVDISNPKTFFSVQFPVAAAELKSGYNPADPEQEGPILQLIPDNPAPAPSNGTDSNGTALVGIYNTHNGENYTGDGGAERVQGNGGVVQVAATLAASLQSLGIPVVRSDTIHDEPNMMVAYAKSVITASKMVRDNPKLQALFDVHRDGVPSGSHKRVIMVDGQPASPVMIVLAEKHPNWQQNEAFAKELLARANQMYPGLILPIYYAADARYNQHLLNHALLLEFGDQYNTLEESERSAQAIARVLAQMIKH